MCAQIKDERLAGFCREHELDGVLIRRRANIAWIADGADIHCDAHSELGTATLLWTPARKIVFTDNVDGPRLIAEEFSPDWEFRMVDWMDSHAIPPGNYASDFPDDCLTDLRASLTPTDVERIKELGRSVGEVVVQLMDRVRIGWSEMEVAGDLIGHLRHRGIVAPVVLVGADERISKYRHPVPTSNKIERHLMVVVCAQRQGLIVAMTRLVHFGALPADLQNRHKAVCRIDEAYHGMTRPGVRWCDALAQGIQAYSDEGYGEEWRKHFQGGPMGYQGRDYWATPQEQRCVVENQAVGWNPSITGTKSEDTILSNGDVVTVTEGWPMCGARPDILVRLTQPSRPAT